MSDFKIVSMLNPSVVVLSGATGPAIAAAGGTQTSGTVVFSNSNNVSFGMAGSVITASVSAGGGGGGGGIGAAAGTQTATSGTVQFVNSNNVTFGMTNSSQITASFSAPAQTTQTQPAGNIAGAGFTSTTTAGVNVVATQNSNGLSMGVPAYITTYAAQTNQTVASGNIAGVGTTFNGTNISGSMTVDSVGINLALSVAPGGGAGDGYNSAQFTNSTANSTMPLVWAGNSNGSGNVTIGLTGSTITMSAPSGGGGGITNVNISAGTTSNNLSAFVFSNSNNVSFGLNGSTVTATATFAQSVQTQASGNIVGAGFTSASTAGSDLAVTNNSLGLSMGVPKYLTTYVAQTTQTQPAGNIAGAGYTSTTQAGSTVGATLNSNGLSMAWPPYITTYAAQTVQPVAFSASGGSSNFSTLNFANSNGVTFSNTNGSVRITHDLQYTSATSAITAAAFPSANTTKFAGTGTTFAGANVSGSMTVDSNGVNLSLSAPTPGGGGAINVSAGTTSNNLQTIVFSNSNGVSFGLNGSTVTASAAGGGFSGLSKWLAYPLLPLAKSSSTLASGTSGVGSTTASFYVNPLYVDREINAQEIEMIFSNGALSAGTGSCTVGYHLGFYTLDTAGGTTALRSVSTFSAAAYISQNSATAQSIHTYWGSTSNSNSTATNGNISAAFMTAGLRDIKVYDASFTLPADTYYLVHCLTMRSSSVNIGASLVTGMYAAGLTNHAYLGQSVQSSPIADRYIGQFSSQVTGAAGNTLSMSMPSSINVTAITVSTSNAGRWLYPRMYN